MTDDKNQEIEGAAAREAEVVAEVMQKEWLTLKREARVKMAEIYPEAFKVSGLRFDDPYEEESKARRRRDDFPGEGWENGAEF